MITKSLEYTTHTKKQVKVCDIPVLDKDHPLNFVVTTRLQLFLLKIERDSCSGSFSFKEYLKKNMKWKDYEELFELNQLKYNA
ncbi:hypothetical protein Q73_07665 [Bacillus coahuilensis m2-6]|uniref:DUF2535 domain-containing protein n=1 Tax=Bacillus coahuilensis p1.1.43 TaxID=1150625 RepID=A0A147K8F5_9BACI|nr:DUF2535 family protein [Bacillus coahuilensis]KUP06489.1 hypothetical protein Q75_08145 [Bacillus coahuilensis p1.1.43]KUP07976.1 hypothetical protein Q73_07665 [Bacillus coahuilensis m2-6]